MTRDDLRRRLEPVQRRPVLVGYVAAMVTVSVVLQLVELLR